MKNWENFTFVCEFTLTAERSLNSNDVERLNTVIQENSIVPGSFSLEGVSLNGEELSGRYMLDSLMIAQDEQEYIRNMQQDLSMLIKSPLNISRSTILSLNAFSNLEKRTANESGAVYLNAATEKYLVIKNDGFLEERFSSEQEAEDCLSDTSF